VRLIIFYHHRAKEINPHPCYLLHLGHATKNLGTASTSTKKMVMPQEMERINQEKNKYHVIIVIFLHQRKENDENAFNKETSGGAHRPRTGKALLSI
jgi:hypothetical protein